jgi:hypothetical protein
MACRVSPIDKSAKRRVWQIGKLILRARITPLPNYPVDTAEPAGTEIEVTPEMIEAGVRAYYENAMWGWESPGGAELRNLLGQVYRDMARLAPNIRQLMIRT